MWIIELLIQRNILLCCGSLPGNCHYSVVFCVSSELLLLKQFVGDVSLLYCVYICIWSIIHCFCCLPLKLVTEEVAVVHLYHCLVTFTSLILVLLSRSFSFEFSFASNFGNALLAHMHEPSITFVVVLCLNSLFGLAICRIIIAYFGVFTWTYILNVSIPFGFSSACYLKFQFIGHLSNQSIFGGTNLVGWEFVSWVWITDSSVYIYDNVCLGCHGMLLAYLQCILALWTN